jgi:hypothetical protein
LALGGLSAVAANAANPYLSITTATTITNTATATQIAGPANYVSIYETGTAAEYYVITGGTTTSGATTGTVTQGNSFNIATPAVGTITVSGYPITNGAAATTAADTLTITVVTALPGTVYSASSVKAASGSSFPITTESTFPVLATASATGAAAFSVIENDAAGLSLTTGYKALSISTTLGNITVPVAIAGVTGSGTSYVAGTPTVQGPYNFLLNGDGRPGTATVSISVNGVAVKSYVVTFTGAAAKIVLTAVNSVVGKGTAAALAGTITANTNAFTVQEFDAAGNVVALNNVTLSLVPADATIATAGALDTSSAGLSSSKGGYSINGVNAGTTTFTVKDSTGTLVSNAVPVRVSSGVPTKVVFTTDASSYAIVSPMKITATVSDDAGVLPAGSYTVFDSNGVVIPGNLLGGLVGASAIISIDNTGSSSIPANAPFSDGTFSVSATGATGVTVTPATYSATSGGATAANAAADAAAEATDAANAATDAANAAADSADQATAAAQDAGDKADAALAAVTALSQQVTDLLAKIADLSAANEALATALAAQSAALASQQKTVAAQSKALAAQKALVARLVRKAKA